MQRIRIVTRHVESAALCGTLGSESADNHMASRPDSMSNLPNVRCALLCAGQEMEHGTVVPHVVSVWRELNLGDIDDEPTYLFCGIPQPLLRHVDRGLRNIQYGDVLVAAREEVVDERGFTTSHINDGRCMCTGCWGEPLGWHSFFGHSFRFRKSVLASPSRRRGLGKGTAFESPSPAVLSKSFRRCRCSQKPRSLRLDFRPDFRPCARILPAIDSQARNANAADCNTAR